MALIQLTCPSCNGKLEADDAFETATCMFCTTQVIIKAPAPPPPPPINVVMQPPPVQHTTVVKYKRKSGGITGFVFAVIVLFFAFVVVRGILTEVDIDSLNNNNNQNNQSGTGRVISENDFISAAEKAGFTIIIEEDYDGFGTYWAGAHLFAEGVIEKEGNEIYVIDYTRDLTVYNAKVEYRLYVSNVKEFGGEEHSGSGADYEFQVNSSDTGFGIAYRVGDVNMYVTAPPEHKEKILSFFDAIGFGVRAKMDD
jgi:hypothetical protein